MERLGSWFHLSRYFDLDYASHGPEALAIVLGLTVDDVFPIEFDVTEYVRGNPLALTGRILKSPLERLSEDEIVALSISHLDVD